MKRTRLALIAAGSAVVCATVAGAARPRYGGVLRVELAAALRTLDPTATPATAARARLLPLVFETLVALDPAGGIWPHLAIDWNSDARSQRWNFRLRSGVTLHDGSILDSSAAATSLRASSNDWKVTTEAGTVVIETARRRPDLLWELADARHAIAVRRPAGEALGSGPFLIERWEPDRRAQLRAHDAHWAGRPFLDAVHIAMGRPVADALVNLELGRADLVGIRPQDVARLTQRDLKIAGSRPIEIVALVVDGARNGPAAETLRRALSLAIDRAAITSTLLQRQAQVAGSVLPPWLSGYGSLLMPDPSRSTPDYDRSAARAVVSSLPAGQRRLVLRLADADPLVRSIAERIAVDARDAGLTVRLDAQSGPASTPADLRIVRAPIAATSPDRALDGVMRRLGVEIAKTATMKVAPEPGAPLDATHRVERALLDRFVIIPVVHLSDLYGVAAGVESSNGPVVFPSGAWNLANVWLRRD